MRGLPVNPKSGNRGEGSACLYFGPHGERCARPAGARGFCEEHTIERSTPSWRRSVRRGGAMALALSALWPLLVDLIRAIARLLR